MEKTQILADPRAAQLRAILVPLAALCQSLSWVGGPRALGVPAAVALRIEELKAAGVSVDACTGLGADAYADPAVLTEYLAGQWLAIFADGTMASLLVQFASRHDDTYAYSARLYAAMRMTYEALDISTDESAAARALVLAPGETRA